jgi:acetyltransferase-like isoleucine patch superfamily enzyme
MFSKIINKLKYKFILSQIKPEIIGYKNFFGKFIPKTGASNMTHISNKQNVFIGQHVFIGHFNYIDGYNKVVIEDGCQITNYVSILTHSSHHTVRLHANVQVDNRETGLISKPIHIGKYSYIGAHSVIMPGTKLGKGCIVSAFSYVNGEFPDYSILRGQPARIVGNTKEIDLQFLEDFPDLQSSYYENLEN